MISIILDTNVLISGLFWGGPPMKILNAVGDNKLCLVTTDEIFEEYTKVIKRSALKFSRPQLLPISDLFKHHIHYTFPFHLLNPVSRDPDDDKFIACALGSGCKLIVSGDKDLLEVSGFAGIEIIKPKTFIEKYVE